eukprot:gene14647-13689_t
MNRTLKASGLAVLTASLLGLYASQTNQQPEMANKLAAVKAINAEISLASKRCVVVGGTSGIGHGVALRLARAGCSVTIVGRKERGIVEEMKAISPDGVECSHSFIPVNAYLLSSVNEAVESITASHDKVDFLVQSQGMATIQGFTPSPEEGLDQKLALHVYSRALFIRGLQPLMAKSEDPRLAQSDNSFIELPPSAGSNLPTDTNRQWYHPHNLRADQRWSVESSSSRECIINAVLVAYSTGLCLVQPNTWAIFHADLERGVKGRTDYMPPFNDRSSWNNFDTMFEPTAFRQAMAKLGVVVVDSDNAALKGSNIEWGDFTVQMGELTTATNGTAQQQLKRRYNRQWAKLNGVRTVFKYDSCYSGFGVSRGDSDLCLAFGADVCHTATASLQPSAFIVAESDRALSLLRHNYPECKVWHAVHMRAFGCQPTTNIIAGAANTIGPAASHKAEALQSWCLYVISEADPEVTKAAFKP